MIELVYVSRASRRYNDQELKALLEVCRANNSEKEITGLLLYDKKGTFIQALEGDESDVVNLFNKIKQDDRHSRVNCISNRPIQQRAFSDWCMGFKLIDDTSLQSTSGYSKIMQDNGQLVSLHDDESMAIELLNYFKNEEQQK